MQHIYRPVTGEYETVVTHYCPDCYQSKVRTRQGLLPAPPGWERKETPHG